MRLGDGEWRAALEYCDQGRITFAVEAVAREAMPPWVRDRIDENARRNALRVAKIEDFYRTLHRYLADARIDFVALKGITQAELASDPPPRVQYDIDLFLAGNDAVRAQELL